MNLTEKQIEDHKAWLQDQKPAHQAYVGVLIADKLTAAESALAKMKETALANAASAHAAQARAEAAESALEGANERIAELENECDAEHDKGDDAHTLIQLIAEGLNLNPEPHQTFNERLLEHSQSLQSRLDAAERDAGRYRWLRDGKTDARIVATQPGDSQPIIGGYFLDRAIDAQLAALSPEPTATEKEK